MCDTPPAAGRRHAFLPRSSLPRPSARSSNASAFPRAHRRSLPREVPGFSQPTHRQGSEGAEAARPPGEGSARLTPERAAVQATGPQTA